MNAPPIESPLVPRIVHAEDGEWYGFGPENVRCVLSSAQTGGAFVLTDVRIDAPGFGPPYHVHTREDETFHVLEGSMTLVVDGARHEMRAGDIAFAPRDVPHRFESGPEGVRMTIHVSGDNFERFHPRFCAAMAAGEMDRIPAIAAEHGIRFLPK